MSQADEMHRHLYRFLCNKQVLQNVSWCTSQWVLLHPSPCTLFLKNMLVAGELFWLPSKEVKSVTRSLLWFRHPIPAGVVRLMPAQQLHKWRRIFQIRSTGFYKAAFLRGSWNLCGIFCWSVLVMLMDCSNPSLCSFCYLRVNALWFWYLWWLKF